VQDFSSNNYVISVQDSMRNISALAWDSLLSTQADANPFMRHAYLSALELSGSACTETGWSPRVVTVRRKEQLDGTSANDALAAAAVLYVKNHSYGEYVFDWAWADAYHRHGLDYYPKAVASVPFTPVPGARLMANSLDSKALLIETIETLADAEKWSSLHILFLSENDLQATQKAGWLSRYTVQFHWNNQHYLDFENFLSHLSQEKRKKIRQERKKVHEAGVTFETLEGIAIQKSDWDFFYKCYSQTYFEHGNAPYLNRDFFEHMQKDMPENWTLFIASRNGQRIACSLIAIHNKVAYGRYWGALERVDCLHFEACYYQPIAWCIANEYQRFEGGAQGEHKMARALLPVKASSAHRLSHPAFADAVERYLEQEGRGIAAYLDNLEARSPLKKG
jgi:predicted N-acyltransferase